MVHRRHCSGMFIADAALACSSQTLLRHVFLLLSIVDKPVNTKESEDHGREEVSTFVIKARC
ncbi:hypothetical protein RchiOBHm_Chr1g0351351 [Rosa chinensis]|uniref:Uncharacterized protein n=1 Tax=Rosa chinensis TaxID=74649 RepID=A0A2P6SGA6_ROSCH|nr:hypothetical protein RchiOBHm_Chr1g0351351 [Rosa chinensis]